MTSDHNEPSAAERANRAKRGSTPKYRLALKVAESVFTGFDGVGWDAAAQADLWCDAMGVKTIKRIQDRSTGWDDAERKAFALNVNYLLRVGSTRFRAGSEMEWTVVYLLETLPVFLPFHSKAGEEYSAVDQIGGMRFWLRANGFPEFGDDEEFWQVARLYAFRLCIDADLDEGLGTREEQVADARWFEAHRARLEPFAEVLRARGDASIGLLETFLAPGVPSALTDGVL